MTPLGLLEALKSYCEECTRDLVMVSRVAKNGTQKAERPPRVFIGELPDKESARKEAPYILLKLLTTKDDDEESTAVVRIIFVTYSQDRQENYIQCLNTLTRVKTKLLEDVVIGNCFSCRKPVEGIIYEDDLEVYQIGEIMTTWEMPQVKRNINQHTGERQEDGIWDW